MWLRDFILRVIVWRGHFARKSLQGAIVLAQQSAPWACTGSG
jgi:hypothetical protein